MTSSSKNAVLMICGMMLQYCLMLGTGIVVARTIGSADYGITNLVRTLFQTAIIIAPLGLDISLQKYVASTVQGGASTWESVSRLRVFTFLVTTASTFLFIVCAGSWLESDIYKIARFTEYLVISFLVLPVSADLGVLGGVLRGRFNPAPHIVTNLYLLPVLRTVLLIALLLCGSGLLGVLIANAISVFGAWLFLNAYIILKRSFPLRTPRWQGCDWTSFLGLIEPSLWMAASAFLYSAFRLFDIILLGVVRPMKEVGEYSVLSIIAQLIQFFPFSLMQTLGSTIAKAYEAKDYAQIEFSLSRYLRNSALSAAPVFGAVAVWGDALHLIFGKTFHFSWEVSCVLALGYLIGGMLGGVGYALSMTGQHRKETAILIAGNLIAIILCFFFAKTGGQVGVASAVCIGLVIVNVSRFIIISRSLGIVPGSIVDLIPAPFCLLSALISRELASLFFNQNLVWLGVCGLWYAVIVTVGFWALLLRQEEKSRILFFLQRLRNATTPIGRTG